MRELAARGIRYRRLMATTRSELATAYHALDLCLVTSRQEGGPKAVLEAMASGVPVVSTRVGQAPEVLEHGRSGYLADVDALGALAEGGVRGPGDGPGAAAPAGGGGGVGGRSPPERRARRWEALLEGFAERRASGA